MWVLGLIFLVLALTFADDKDKTMAWLFGVIGFLMLMGVFG